MIPATRMNTTGSVSCQRNGYFALEDIPNDQAVFRDEKAVTRAGMK
jgi:hypothetical protein